MIFVIETACLKKHTYQIFEKEKQFIINTS